MTDPPRNFDPDRPRVFLSYARGDGEGFARDIRDRLERDAPGLKLWRDREAMEGGVGWWRQITEGLDVVEVMLLVLTPAAVKSEVVTREWRYAHQRGVHVYPVHGWPGVEIDFRTLPKWMGKAQACHHEQEWSGLLDHLKHPGPLKPVPYMADDLPRGFVEHPDEFNRLRTLLLQGDNRDPAAITAALYGVGGFGKTTLALCHDEEIISAFNDGILWVTLGERPNFVAALGKLYTALTGNDREDFRDVEDARQHLAERLEDRTCLIVVDDVWDPNHLQHFLRSGRQCAWPITTRQFDVAAEAESVSVEEMTPDQAVNLLTARFEPKPEPADLGQLTGRLLAFESPVIRGFLDRLVGSCRQPWLRPLKSNGTDMRVFTCPIIVVQLQQVLGINKLLE
jgi:NB-ARC domain/TIR domain